MQAAKLAVMLFMISVILVPVPRIVRAAPAPVVDLPALVEQLRADPSNTELRKKIIEVARKQKPAVPEEAKRHMGRAQGFAEQISSKDDFQQVVAELQEAVAAAPWLPAPYYNLGVAQEKYEDYGGARESFSNYLLAAPDAANADEVRNRIYKLEALAEKAAGKIAEAELAAADLRKQMEENIAAGAAASEALDSRLSSEGNTGNTWIYSTSTSNSGASTGQTQPIESIKREAGTDSFEGRPAFSYAVEVRGDFNNDKREFFVKEKDGIYSIGDRAHLTSVKYASDSQSTTVESPPGLFIPLPLHVGARWTINEITNTSTITSVPADTPRSEMKLDLKGEGIVARRESVTVPAGTFDCFVLDSRSVATLTSIMVSTKMTTWIAPGVGVVKQVIESDTEVTMANASPRRSHSSIDSVLKGFRISHKPAWGWEDGDIKPITAKK